MIVINDLENAMKLERKSRRRKKKGVKQLGIWQFLYMRTDVLSLVAHMFANSLQIPELAENFVRSASESVYISAGSHYHEMYNFS